MAGGGWQPTFDAESKNAKTKIHIFTGGWLGWWVDGDGWQPTFDAESKNAKIQKFTFSQVGGWGCQPTFDAESKNAKI